MEINAIGVNPYFRAVDELIRPTDVMVNNLVKLKKGSFYLTGLSVKTVSTNTTVTNVVVKSVDVQATKTSAQTVYRYLHFPDGVNEDLYVTYYYFSGVAEAQKETFLSTLDGLDSEDGRPDYRKVEDKPFALGEKPHIHRGDDAYGLDEIGMALVALLNTTVNNVDGLLSQILQDIQPSRDNRLKTNNKTIVGAINELVSLSDGIDLSRIQAVSSDALNTPSKVVVEAINHIKSTTSALAALVGQGLLFVGTLTSNTTLSTNDNTSRLWTVGANCTITCDFNGEGVSSKQVSEGDIIFLDGTTRQFLHHGTGRRADDTLDADVTITSSNTGSATVAGVLTAYNAIVLKLAHNDTLNPLIDTLVKDTDLSVAAASKSGFYVVAVPSLSLTIGSPAVTETLTAGTVVYVTQGTHDYTIDTDATIKAPALSFNMPDTQDVHVERALKSFQSDLATKVENFGNGIEHRGYLINGTYNLTTHVGSGLFIVSGQECDVIITGKDGDETHTVYYGDLVFRKQSTGEFIIARIGSKLDSQLNQSDLRLNTKSKNVVDAAMEIENNLMSTASYTGTINLESNDVTTLPTHIQTGEYVVPLPDPKSRDNLYVVHYDPNALEPLVVKEPISVLAKWWDSDEPYVKTFDRLRVLTPTNDYTGWVDSQWGNGLQLIWVYVPRVNDVIDFPPPNVHLPQESWLVNKDGGTIRTVYDGDSVATERTFTGTTIAVPNDDFTGWRIVDTRFGEFISLQPRYVSKDSTIPWGTTREFEDGSLGNVGTLAGVINKIRSDIVGASQLKTGDLIVSGELKDGSYAVPCEGQEISIMDYPRLGSIMSLHRLSSLNENTRLRNENGQTLFRMPIKPRTYADYRSRLEVIHPRLRVTLSASPAKTAYASSVNRLAISSDGHHMVLIFDTNDRNVDDQIMYYNPNTNSKVYKTVPGDRKINAVLAIPKTSRFYLLATGDSNSDNPGNVLYVFDPNREVFSDEFTLVYDNMPSDSRGVVLSHYSGDVIYQLVRGGPITDIYKIDVTQANSAVIIHTTNFNILRVNQVFQYQDYLNVLNVDDSGWVNIRVLEGTDISNTTNVGQSFVTHKQNPHIDENAATQSATWNNQRNMIAMTYYDTSGNNADYQRKIFWYNSWFELVDVQTLPEYDAGDSNTHWDYIVSLKHCEITDRTIALVRSGNYEYILVTQSRLKERYYIKA